VLRKFLQLQDIPGKLANPCTVYLTVPVAIPDTVVDELRQLLQSGDNK